MKKLFLTLSILLCLALKGWPATITASQSGNWSSSSTWGGGPIPVAGDAVIINTYTITIDVNNAACASISLGATATASIRFSGGSKLVVSGNITLGGSGAKKGNLDFTDGGHLLTATFSNWAGTFTRGTGTVEVTGTIASFGSADYWNFHHLILSGSANVTLGRNIACYGNLTLGPGTTFTSNSNYLNLYANWTIDATATFNGGSTSSDYVVFHGADTQYINGNATLHNVWANKTSNNPIVLSGEITIDNIIWWDRGIFASAGSGKLILLAGYTDSNGANNNQRCFALAVRKVGNTAYTFPLCSGDGINYSPLTISAPASVTDAFTAKYFFANPTPAGYSATSKEALLDHVSDKEYWTLDRTSGTSSVTVRLTWGSWSGGITNLTDLRVAKWNGSQWFNAGNTATSGTTSSGTITSSAVSTFSPFTLASSTAENPLPVTLLSFNAYCRGQNILIQWQTSSETNNDYFTLERSVDGRNWVAAAKVAGSSNSTALQNYSIIDTAFSNRNFYYRLKQTDYSGQSRYSEVVATKSCREKNSMLTVSNMSEKGKFQLFFGAGENRFRAIEVFNAYGTKVYFSNRFVPILDLTGKPAGVFFLVLHTSEGRSSHKILIP